MNHKFRIHSKELSEYVYHTLTTLTHAQRQRLSPEEQKIFKSNNDLYNFSHKEQLDRILLLMTKIGKQVTLRIGDEDQTADQLEFNTVNTFQFPQKRIEATDAMARENIFYMSASDIMLSSMMSSQNIHSQIYALSKQALSMGDMMTSIRLTVSPQEKKIDTATKGFDDINSLFLQMLNSLSWARQTLSLEQGTMRVLAMLYYNRHGAYTIQEIAEKTMMKHNPAFLSKNIVSLLKGRMIISDKNSGPKVGVNKGKKAARRIYYMIAPDGVKAIMEYYQYIYQAAFG